MFPDLFGPDDITEELLLEERMGTFHEQYNRHIGGVAVVSWVQSGDPSADALAEVMDMTSGFDSEDESPIDEDDQELHADTAMAVCEAMESFGSVSAK